MACKSLRQDQQARFDPMITGFNPTDMYAADHVRRVLHTFPGVFSGIGKAGCRCFRVWCGSRLHRECKNSGRKTCVLYRSAA